MSLVTAYFLSAESAIRAGDDLSQLSGLTDKIFLGSKNAEDVHAYDYFLKSTFIGTAIGTVMGLVIRELLDSGLLTVIFPIVGLITGTVTGALAGCLMDFITYDSSSAIPCLSCTVKYENSGFATKILKEKGAIKVELAVP